MLHPKNKNLVYTSYPVR